MLLSRVHAMKCFCWAAPVFFPVSFHSTSFSKRIRQHHHFLLPNAQYSQDQLHRVPINLFNTPAKDWCLHWGCRQIWACKKSFQSNEISSPCVQSILQSGYQCDKRLAFGRMRFAHCNSHHCVQHFLTKCEPMPFVPSLFHRPWSEYQFYQTLGNEEKATHAKLLQSHHFWHFIRRLFSRKSWYALAILTHKLNYI